MSVIGSLRRVRKGNRFSTPRLEVLEDRTAPATGIGTVSVLNNSWSIRDRASAGPADATFRFGSPGTVPVVGDWNGDGKDDIGTFNPLTATWSLKYGASAGHPDAGVFAFGSPGTFPVVGDWNGDTRDDIGVYDPRTFTWSLRFGASPGLANAGTFQFGARGRVPVVGDWDGDGRDGIGLYNPVAGTWALRQTANAGAFDAGVFRYGPLFARPVVGDWNGDGRDGIGTVQPRLVRVMSQFGSRQVVVNTWSLRQTANAGAANAGTFNFGGAGTRAVVGDWDGPVRDDGLVTLQLKPLDVDLLGLTVQTSPITLTVSAERGDGKLLGNLLDTVGGALDLQQAGDALNNVLGSVIDLVNTASLAVSNIVSGPLDDAAPAATQVLELWVAPIHLDLLGAEVDTSPIRVTITAFAGDNQILGNVVTQLLNLFNPPLPEDGLDIDFINGKLDELIAALDQQIPGIVPAESPPVTISDGQILNVTVPALDLDLLGLNVQTSPITVNASAEAAPGALLGNVLTAALNTLGATPENLAGLSQNVNDLLARVIGVLNAASLTLSDGALGGLPTVLQTLARATLLGAPVGATTPILDLVIASPDGTQPPVEVDLLGLTVTTSNIDAHLFAETGDTKILGNLLYNLANLANPGGPGSLLNLINQLSGAPGSGTTPDTTVGTSPTQTPDELVTLRLKPLDIDLLGVKVTTDEITVKISTLGGDGKLLGNLLGGVNTLLDSAAVSNALNQVLGNVVDLVNSVDLNIPSGVLPGTFNGTPETLDVLELFVAPVRADLLGLVVETSAIHLKVTATSGDGQVLANLLVELAHLFDGVQEFNIDTINGLLEDLIEKLDGLIPTSIPPAPTPPVTLGPDQFLELTVPALDLDLLGLLLKTSPITVNASAHPGDGLLLGNVLTTALNTLDATPENLTGLSENLNTILSRIVGVLNAADLTLLTGALDGLPAVIRTLAEPLLIAPQPGATAEILHLIIAAPNENAAPVDVDLMGLEVTTSDIDALLLAQTGNGNVLGNLLYNVAHLLDPDGVTTLLFLLAQLGKL